MVIDRLIFVCSGNTCRSPMAEYIARSLAPAGQYEIISRGLSVFGAEPMNVKAQEALDALKIAYGPHVARSLNSEDLVGRCLILTMTDGHRLSLNRLLEEYGLNVRMETLRGFAGEGGNVRDPYGQPQYVYDMCCQQLKRSIEKVIQKLSQEAR